MDGDGDVIEREEPLGRRAHGQGPGDGERHARHGLECRQRGEREHCHHDLTQVVRVDGGDTEREDRGDRHGEADLNHEGRRGGQASVAPLQRVGCAANASISPSTAASAPKASSSGAPAQRVDDAGRQIARKLRQSHHRRRAAR